MASDCEESRRQALEDLLFLRLPVERAVQRLKEFPWDSERELAILTRVDAQRLLTAFLDGRLVAAQCQEWAFALEGRDDLALEGGSENLLKNFLFEISSPELNGELTTRKAEEWRTRVS